MLHLLWGLLNLGLLLFFLGICFRATKLIRENLGLVASIVFVFGLLAFARSSGTGNDVAGRVNNQVRKWTFTSDKEILTGIRSYKRIDIDETVSSTVDLGIAYGLGKNSKKLVPIEATSTMSGFVSGHKWRPQVILVDTTPGKSTYRVDGLLEWNLLSATIYRQFKTYSGIINTENKEQLYY